MVWQIEWGAAVSAGLQRVDLGDGGWLLYQEGFLAKEESDSSMRLLQERCEWAQLPGIFGYLQPRMIASYGDAGVSYRYSGRDYGALPWLEELLVLRERVQTVAGRYNYCLCNRYRTGQDSMGWHADDEPEMGEVIGSLSLGAERKFRIRHNETRQTRTFAVGHGTLIVMGGTMQRYWQHCVPKTKRVVGERVNLTFREVRKIP
jgi:alkylated DNA repair dioxygenase AlkB